VRSLGFSSILLFCGLLASCAVVPRLPLDVQRAVNRDDMRVLHTQSIDLYYPAHLAAQARTLAERAEGCIEPLRKRIIGHGGLSTQRIELLFPDLPYNNAFVNPPVNGDFFSVVPSQWSFDIVTETGLPPDPGYVACHELTHYIHAQQTLRSLGLLDRIFGSVITPQYGLDSWFWEGLATYYEQALSPGTGRPGWPVWEGMFHAAVAGRRVHGGDLNELNRKIHWGNNYLYGSHFIDWLVREYGEYRLWKLIERQGESFFFPFIVNWRFNHVYDKHLSTLLDEFADYLARAYPVRVRPASQRVVRQVGMNGRLARALDGTEAVISDAMDAPPTLTVYTPEGAVRYTTRLTDVLVRRKLVTPDTRLFSGLRFSRDSQTLYFVAVDRDLVFQQARLLALDLRSQTLRLVIDDLGGLGGDISPDGREYLYVRVDGKGHTLALLDLQSGQTRDLFALPAGAYLTGPTFSPDGTQIVGSLFDGSYTLALFDARTGARTSTVREATGPLYDPSFIDDDQLLFLGKHEGRFQVYRYRLSTRQATRISDAPYLALSPRAHGQTVRFLNREGFGYTLDEVALEPASAVSAFTAAPRVLADIAALDGGAPASEHDGGVEAAQDAAVQDAVQDAAAAPPIVDFSSTVFTQPVEAPALPPAAPHVSTGDLNLHVETTAAPPRPGLRRPLTVALDEPYSVFPRLLIPSIRAPQLGVSNAPGQNILGFYLGGTDALGKHRWGLSGGIQPKTQLLSGAVGYLNAQLAPALLLINASQTAYDDQTRERIPGSDERRTVSDRRRQRDLTVAMLLALRTTQLVLALHATEDRRQDEALPVYRQRSLGGGTLQLVHSAYESTAMSGPRRGYVASVSTSYYPDALGTLRSDVADLRGELQLYAPLPLSRRHTLQLGLRARAVREGEPDKLLQLGGTDGSATLYDHPDNSADDQGYPGLVPQLRFRESLRGFESEAFFVDQLGLVDLTYRYPLIIDRGTATSLSILPAFFLRQVDLELFASGASDRVQHLRQVGHLAVGGALSVSFVWLAPVVLRYQLAQRFTDDRGLSHLISLGTPL
jgi:hypothetical protein